MTEKDSTVCVLGDRSGFRCTLNSRVKPVEEIWMSAEPIARLEWS